MIMTKERKFILICVVVGLFAMVLPYWFRVCFYGICSAGDNGFRFMRHFGTGYLAFLCLVGAGAGVFLGDKGSPLEKNLWSITLACGLVASVAVLWNWSHHVNVLGSAGLGFPLYLAAASSVGIPLALLASWFFKSEK